MSDSEDARPTGAAGIRSVFFAPESILSNIDLTLVRVEASAPVMEEKPAQEQEYCNQDIISSQARTEPEKPGNEYDRVAEIGNERIFELGHLGHIGRSRFSYKFSRLLERLSKLTSTVERGVLA